MTTLAPERATTAEYDTVTTAPSWSRSFLVSSSLMLSLVRGTGTAAGYSSADQVVVADAVTGNGGFSTAARSGETTASAGAVRQLRSRSGLSWDDLSRLFGVSRRSVHKWANGGAMNSKHIARLAELTARISSITGSPSEVRAKLLAPDERGRTLFQELVRTARPTTDRPEGFAVEDLVGARRDGDITTHGEFIDVTDIDDGTKRDA